MANEVRVLLAGPEAQVRVWKEKVDGPEVLLAVVTPGRHFSRQLTSQTHDLALLDAAGFPSPRAMLETVPLIKSPVIYVSLPNDVPRDRLDEIRAKLESFPAVKKTFVQGPTDEELLEPVFGRGGPPAPVSGNNGKVPREKPQDCFSPDVITVWNQAGGVGKTTVASNLAFLAAEQGHRTLLVGLGGPDYVPLIIKGLKKRPNLTGWHSNPTPEGLRAVVQEWSQNLHVVAGFPDMFSKGEYLDIGDDQPASIPNLAGTAIQEGYSVLIFDASPSHIAASALSAANHVVLVARPSQENVYRTAVAYQTITERLEGSYRVDPENIRVLLNRTSRSHGLAPDVWHARVSRMTADHFPPLSATIPEIPEVSDYQDKRTFPVQQEETFREALMPLANSLFGDHGQVYQKEVTFLGIKFRW